jgi:hypothetical protein
MNSVFGYDACDQFVGGYVEGWVVDFYIGWGSLYSEGVDDFFGIANFDRDLVAVGD